MRFAITLLALPILSLAAFAGDYSWVPIPDAPTQIALYRDGIQVGGFDQATGIFRPFDRRTQTWGAAGPCPCCLPAGQTTDYGVQQGRISGRERITRNGREISRQEAQAEIDRTIPDDASRLRLTVIGPTEERQRVVSELPADLRASLLVTDYPPDHWAVQVGFRTDGHPTIYLQKPDGTVLHRQDDYTGGSQALAEAIRRARPDYQPSRDPNLNTNPLSSIPLEFWIIGGVVLLGFFFFKRKSS